MGLLVKRRHLASVWPPRTQRDFYCCKGSRAFFKDRGWSWGDFLRNGLPAEKFIETGDAMAMKAVQNAQLEASGGR